ncbi:MAG: VWA domain-containing protein [Acidobacteriota bacterium]
MRLLLLLSATVLSTASAGAIGQAARPTFNTGVDLVTVVATVTDARGRLVPGLTRDDFEVTDRGEVRAISEFRVERAPLSVAILVDASGSMTMADRAAAARMTAAHLLSGLEAGTDEAAIYTFDTRLHEVAPFTVDTRAAQGALGEVEPFGATSLHDAVAETARRVAARTGRRRAVVVVTDGVDTASRRTPAEVSAMASAIDVPVYVLATVLPIDDPGVGGRAPRVSAGTATTRELARWTGGAFHFVSTPSASIRAAGVVLAELRHQYLIAFEPGAGDGWHPIEVRARRKHLTVRARGGYMVAAARPFIGIEEAS